MTSEAELKIVNPESGLRWGFLISNFGRPVPVWENFWHAVLESRTNKPSLCFNIKISNVNCSTRFCSGTPIFGEIVSELTAPFTAPLQALHGNSDSPCVAIISCSHMLLNTSPYTFIRVTTVVIDECKFLHSHTLIYFLILKRTLLIQNISRAFG